MRPDWIRKDVYEKVVLVKGIIKSTIPELKDVDDTDLKLMLCHLSHFNRDDENQTLTELEMILFDTLIRNDISPGTTYKWMCLTSIPKDLFHQLSTGRISQKQALRYNAKRQRDREIEQGLQIMQMVRDSMRRL